MTKLFVGNLPYTTTSQDLNDLFAPLGAVVSATVITDRFTGQSRGFGFVEMSNDDEAQKAIQELNDKDINGRKLVVSVAKPREERSDRGGSGGGFNRDRNRGGDRR